MQIHLMRHGVAAAATDRTGDAGRALTAEGAAEVQLLGEGLAATGIVFDEAYSSPLVRARETARIVTAAQAPRPEVEELIELAPGLSAPDLFRALRARTGASGSVRILLVGHEPDMGQLAGLLLGRSEVPFPLQPASILRIDVEMLPPRSPGSLLWMLTSGLAKALRP